ncbi:anillin_N domain-containing protein [Caerostris darwini]|uniref:Anillin_N domain-containing protein n=1 Tax=Caerostris darwini TaxID=1538125 RepID=A0AAV4W6E8_9ARAC|nr:anillin_N domain-containing protein [Caerostris darwini]
MDLDDSFTQKLLMRSKARKEYLQEKKLESPLGKKRAALVEEQQIPAQANSITKESPKRLCVETKEVKRQEENVSPEKEVHLMARGLAAIRRKNSNQDVSNEKKDNPEMNKPATYFFSTNSSEVCSNRKTRLNNLAAQINGWEDNLSSKPIISKANIINERKNVNKPMGKEDTKKLPPREIFFDLFLKMLRRL